LLIFKERMSSPSLLDDWQILSTTCLLPSSRDYSSLNTPSTPAAPVANISSDWHAVTRHADGEYVRISRMPQQDDDDDNEGDDNDASPALPETSPEEPPSAQQQPAPPSPPPANPQRIRRIARRASPTPPGAFPSTHGHPHLRPRHPRPSLTPPIVAPRRVLKSPSAAHNAAEPDYEYSQGVLSIPGAFVHNPPALAPVPAPAHPIEAPRYLHDTLARECDELDSAAKECRRRFGSAHARQRLSTGPSRMDLDGCRKLRDVKRERERGGMYEERGGSAGVGSSKDGAAGRTSWEALEALAARDGREWGMSP